MRGSMVVQSFLPFAARFFSRHPTKLGKLRQHWIDYAGRFERIAVTTDRNVGEVEAILYDLELREPFFQEFNGLGGVAMNCIVCYAIVRLTRPGVVVETGVNEGRSSCFILLAMEHNRHGRLYSVDLPNQDVELCPGGRRQKDGLPPGKETGFLVPDGLRKRWQLQIGNAREVLPQLLPPLGPIDIFIHDSLHTYDHMMFEYRTAWPYLREGGILLSDDTDYNAAFSDFAADVQHGYIKFDYRVGAIRKGRKLFDYQ